VLVATKFLTANFIHFNVKDSESGVGNFTSDSATLNSQQQDKNYLQIELQMW